MYENCNLRLIVISFQRESRRKKNGQALLFFHLNIEFIIHSFVYASAPLCFIVSEIFFFFNLFSWWINLFFFGRPCFRLICVQIAERTFLLKCHTQNTTLLFKWQNNFVNIGFERKIHNFFSASQKTHIRGWWIVAKQNGWDIFFTLIFWRHASHQSVSQSGRKRKRIIRHGTHHMPKKRIELNRILGNESNPKW